MWSRSIFSSAAAPFTSTSASSMNSSAMALEDRLAGLDRDAPHVAARRGCDHVLHLHGVHDQQRLARGDGVALLHRRG